MRHLLILSSAGGQDEQDLQDSQAAGFHRSRTPTGFILLILSSAEGEEEQRKRQLDPI
jgi:hypothetical protein